ncbi:MAG: hypothetical protein ACXVJD_18240 [Mucilaginibacter sp.]
MRRSGYGLLVVVLLLSSLQTAVAQNQNKLLISQGHLILQIDPRSPVKEIDSILKVAGLSSSIAQKVLKGDFASIRNDGWSAVTRKNNIIRFDRSLSVLNDNPQSSPYRVTIPNFGSEPGYPSEAKYGVNKYSLISVFSLPSGLTRFILPGYMRARRVFLSGSFNNWSTLRDAMTKVDGGWIFDIKLDAGAYQYKFIIDGHWITDPNNLIEVDDGAGNTNSIFYKYNYTIKLPGYPSASKVTVAGDFNDWDENELVMEKRGDTWIKQLYLKEGKHVYHFLVDGRRVTDPGNPVQLKDEGGKLNSVLSLGETVKFNLAGYTKAKNVFIAGDFNDWKPDEYSLEKTSGGWALRLDLPAGNYQYKFIVDGEWLTDPANPHYALEKRERNSFMAVKPNHTFKLKGHAGAESVTLTGDFNEWDRDGYTMARKGDEWVIDLYLKPGKYLYKFKVDNKLIIDPGNKLWEPGEEDSHNSVLWIEY